MSYRFRLAAGAAGGAILAAAAAGAAAPGAAAAPAKKARAFDVKSVNVESGSSVPLDQVVEIRFTQPVARASVTPAVFQIRGENAPGTGFTRQVVGEFQVARDVVRFFPRLPTHLRNPADPARRFFPAGGPNDDAGAHAGLAPNTRYQITIVGSPAAGAARSDGGRALRRTFTTRFSTSKSAKPDALWSTSFYAASPPPASTFSNPNDRPPDAQTQYATTGGARDVPTAATLSLFCANVPLSPRSVRRDGNVTLTRVEQNGDASSPRPVDADVFLEQSYESVRIALEPRFPLTERSVYALRVSKDVSDLTEQYEFAARAPRQRLREIYDFLSAARAHNPTTPWEQLVDPPAAWTGDWPRTHDAQFKPIPGAIAARGVLKRNLLVLGDTRPDEIDPRVMLVFSTRDEPVAKSTVRVDFTAAEGLFDAVPSTADWDTAVPGAAAAAVTVAGGTGVDGDFRPTASITVSSDAYAGGVMNFRDVVIPAGVTVTLTGSRPIEMRAFNFRLDGALDLSGRAGATWDPLESTCRHASLSIL